jgi:hypothetical protein
VHARAPWIALRFSADVARFCSFYPTFFSVVLEMVETYGSEEQRFYYMTETVFGTTPDSSSMISVPADSIDAGLDPGNIRLRGLGSHDLQAIKKGLREVSCKVSYPLPSTSPIDLLRALDWFLSRVFFESLSESF